MSTISNEELIEKISGVVEGCQPTTQEIAMATELLALRKERERAEPVHDPDVCDHEVFEKGASACLVDIPKDVAEIICRGISAATGCMIDWHYVGGRVHIKALRTVPPALPVAVPVVPDGLRIALSNAGIAAPESDEMLWASQQDYIQMLVTWVKDRKPFKPVAVPE
ncbi:hypothetical protein SMZ18_000767 [Cronobacter dublinensis]|nr:hypothetical protein [Cronobacter dublinensis]